MKRKALVSVFALVLFVSVLVVPGLNSAEKKVIKSNPSTFLKKPVLILSSFLPVLTSIFDNNDTVKNSPSSSKSKIKPTADSVAPRPSNGD